MSDPAQFEGLDQEIAAPVERDVPCEFRTGNAGTGKTFGLLEATRKDPSSMLLCSTTGISAVNLSAITINSALGYFDTLSMQDAFVAGRLTRALRALAEDYRMLAVDECSMLDADQLDFLYRATREVNLSIPFGLLLVGDFAQLRPVKGRWCFDAIHWDKFAANTTRLAKVYRQTGGEFLDALNLVRRGRGGEAAEVLDRAGVVWHTQRDMGFNGTTIVPVNEQVNRHNDLLLDTVPGPRISLTARRWGKQRSEWGLSKRTGEWGIPPVMDLKVGAYVMLKANSQDFSFVNGDCGHVESISEDRDMVKVKVIRSGRTESIYKITRNVEAGDKPDVVGNGEWGKPFRNTRSGKWVVGQIEYMPISLAWASTVHKSQSLTLDRVQVDMRHQFIGAPNMMYVAMSRCRTLEGLRLVGTRETFIGRVKVDPRVEEYL